MDLGGLRVSWTSVLASRLGGLLRRGGDFGALAAGEAEGRPQTSWVLTGANVAMCLVSCAVERR